MEASLNPQLIIWNLISFFIMVIIVKYVVWPKIIQFIEDRQKRIEDLLKVYNERNEEVAKLVEKMKLEGEQVSVRRIKMIDDARKETKKIRDEILDKAQQEAHLVLEQAKLEIQKEKHQAMDEVRNNMSMIVVETVKTILCNVVDEQLDKKIIQELEKSVNIKHEA